MNLITTTPRRVPAVGCAIALALAVTAPAATQDSGGVGTANRPGNRIPTRGIRG